MTELFMPYEFDTRKQGRLLAMLMLAAAATMAVAGGALAVLEVVPAETLALVLPLIGIVALADIAAALYLYRRAGGSFGTVGKLHLIVDPDRFLGLASNSHLGSFIITDFAELQLEKRLHFTALTLVGKDPRFKVLLGTHPHAEAERRAAFLVENIHHLKVVTQ